MLSTGLTVTTRRRGDFHARKETMMRSPHLFVFGKYGDDGDGDRKLQQPQGEHREHRGEGRERTGHLLCGLRGQE